MNYKRRISDNEYAYLAAGKAFSHLIIKSHISGSGYLSQHELQTAVNRASQNFPGASLRKKGSYWINTHKPPLVRSIDSKHRSSGFFEFINQALGMDPKKGPTCDILLYSKDQEIDIVFRSLHAVMDGAGLNLWVKAVFSALHGEDFGACLADLNEDECVAQFEKKNRSHEILKPSYRGIGKNSGNLLESDFASTTLYAHDPKILAKIANGTSKILSKAKDSHCLFMVPCDLRKHLSAYEALNTGNLTLPIFIPVHSNSSEESIMKDLLLKMSAKDFQAKGRYDCLNRWLPSRVLASSFKKLWKYMNNKNLYLVSAIFSHVGKIRLSDYSTERFTANKYRSIPCTIPIAPLSIVISENDLYTEICLLTSKKTKYTAKKLLSQIIHESNLGSLCPKPKKPVIRKEASLHQLFEQQVLSSPNAICLEFAHETMSFEELNNHANQLAHKLIKSGIKKGDRVGLGLERSFDLYIGMIAILKAGGCFVALDLSLPTKRLGYMINDANLRIVLCTAEDRNKFGSTVRCISKFQEKWAMPPPNPKLAITEGDSCYIMYTSGSTGQPKGVINYHVSLVNHFRHLDSLLRLSQGDRTIQKTPLSFDAALLEIFLPLFSGARLFISKSGQQRNIGEIVDIINKKESTFLSLTPSYLEMIIESLPRPNTVVKFLLIGGESFTMSTYKRASIYFPNARIINLYGPCEAAIDSLIFEATPHNFKGSSLPIGKPIENMQAYVVNQKLQIMPTGAEGELLIAGAGVGGPYIGNKADSTKFINNPFNQKRKERAYKTGDKVKLLADGNFLFLGRMDKQIKVLGMRIELEEIENHIMNLDGIKQAVVITRVGNNSTHLSLHAHYSCIDKKIDPKVMRQKLSEQLPQSMIPASLSYHLQLPIKLSGKVDRSALEKMVPTSSPRSSIKVPDNPTNRTEKDILSLWTKLLKANVCYDSDFFELGGNSILAITLIESIRKELAYNLDLELVYKFPIYRDFVNEVKAQSYSN